MARWYCTPWRCLENAAEKRTISLCSSRSKRRFIVRTQTPKHFVVFFQMFKLTFASIERKRTRLYDTFRILKYHGSITVRLPWYDYITTWLCMYHVFCIMVLSSARELCVPRYDYHGRKTANKPWFDHRILGPGKCRIAARTRQSLRDDIISAVSCRPLIVMLTIAESWSIPFDALHWYTPLSLTAAFSINSCDPVSVAATFICK